jgi:sterol desaturase/sphingolipid hydroxylase (fatty acid hydroxylase superfamily)
LDD